MISYRYGPLSASNIRLLTLLPGPFDAGVNIVLKHVELAPDQAPRYEALSYTWGSSESPVDISILQDNHPSSLPITQNLAMALRHLRYPQTSRALWVDAICINQQDIEERSRQVARMADIFRSAMRVLVWLGPELDQSALALDAFAELASRITVEWESWSIQPVSSDLADSEWLRLDKQAPFDNNTYVAIARLLHRSWFERLWVWQEVFLAENGADLVCGNKSIEWESFRKAILCFYRRRTPSITGLRDGVTRAFQVISSDDQPSLRTILRRTKDCQCSDERDRIYAVLNLVNQPERLDIKPDYSKSIGEVFQHVALQSIFEVGRLSIITACEMHQRPREMPSWVPDWRTRKQCKDIWNPKACWNSLPQVRYEHNGILKVMGSNAATIEATHNIDLSNTLGPNLEATANAVRQVSAFWEPFLFDHPSHVKNGIIAGTLCRTLCCNAFSHRYEPPDPNHLDFERTLTQFLKLVDCKNELCGSLLHDCAPYLDGVYAATLGRIFFITENGFVGLAPRAARRGDQLYVLLGCQSPMLLRPEEDCRFSVVGECYAHGLMDGEALLGPLSDNWTRVARFDAEKQSLWDAFVDHEGRICQIEDPRLGPLPYGWQITDHPLKHIYSKFRDEATGEASIFDPRMLPNHLRTRGVNLQEICMI